MCTYWIVCRAVNSVLDTLVLVLHLELLNIHVRLLGTTGMHGSDTLALAALDTGTLPLVAQEAFLIFKGKRSAFQSVI